jgi:hypothetical protein
MSADDTSLTAAQRDDLRAIAAEIIPASPEFDVPGADDPAIQADIVATLGRDAGLVREALDQLARLAGRPLASLDPARREAVAIELPCAGRGSGGGADPRRPTMLLPRRSRSPLSWTGTAAALSEGPCIGGWRLVAARPRPGAAADVAPSLASGNH